MATSLAQQLQRLKTPQTDILTDRKKRASLLFDEKEAAEKDRETIFDIGYSGFQDLVKLNPSFLQFESSLFDKNARELQRAVESKEVNDQLNDVLKKFLIHLSPYLLLQPTHKCLEWLIRRFDINRYNKDEMMMLILPYHESKIFVRCVQTMRFPSNDKWFWLKPIQENGVPLSKQALLNRTGSDTSLLSFICESVMYATDMLQNRLQTLQVYYAFFCTSIIGALEVAKINESHISKTFKAIKKGLKSESIDYCAAALMIIGQLVNKVKLKQKILEKFVSNLIQSVSHSKLQPDVIVLLILIYRNQCETIQEIPLDVLANIVYMKWIPCAVLSFLFSIVCTDDNINLFEKLYHYNAQHRIEAVKYLVKNLEKLSFSDDSKTLLKNSIAERLGDDSPLVVKEALKFSTDTLTKFIDSAALRKKLNEILDRTLQKPSGWENVGLAALRHLTKLCNKQTEIDTLITVLPFLLQPTSLSVEFVHRILSPELGKQIRFIQNCRDAIRLDDKDTIANSILSEFEARRALPAFVDVFKYIESIPAEELTLNKSFYSMLLLSYSINKSLTVDKATEILNIIRKNESLYQTVFAKDNKKWGVYVATGNYPINLNIICIRNIVDAYQFNELTKDSIDFSKPKPVLILFQNILSYFALMMSNSPMNGEIYKLVENAMQDTFKKILRKSDKQIDFLSNYFIVDALESDANNVFNDGKTNVFMIEYFNKIVGNDDNIAKSSISLATFIRILSALRSKNKIIRESAFETLEVYMMKKKTKYTSFFAQLLRRKNEIEMDENQLALIIFKIFEKQSSPDLSINLNEFVGYIAEADNKNEFLVALLLEALVHVNNENMLKSIVDKATDIMVKAVDDTAAPSGPIILDTYKSTIIRNILSRFTHETIQLVKTAPNAWKLLTKSGESYNIFVKSKSKQISVSKILVSLFDNDLFAKLSAEHQRQLISLLVHSATYSQNIELYSSVHKFFKQIELSAKVCIHLLEDMAQVQSTEKMDVDEERCGRQNRNSTTADIPYEILKSKSWKCGVTWLEFLQNKQTISENHLLISPLFGVLQKCLQFEDQSGVEYVKQLILALLHHVCVLISPNGQKHNLISEKTFKIEPVVKCIRGTQNPQTHHHALQLLSHSARMLPDQVLHNMVDIFTFMGSSVVRHDDAYSFQIIESIIPTLTRVNDTENVSKRNELVVPVLKVFSDIILDVPEHRRLPLYTKLLETLNPNEYLWMFITILIESYITHQTAEAEKPSGRHLSLNVQSPQRSEIALVLAKEFNCETIMISVTHLIEFLQKLPVLKPTNESEKLPNTILILFNIDACTKKQFRHFKYEVLEFINTLTSSVEFVNKVAVLDEEETKAMKERYQNAIISILTYIPIVSKAVDQKADIGHADYWKMLLHNCFDILENFISLLSSNLLLVVVEGLLSHKLSNVRRRVIELLINKFQHSTDIFVDENIPQLVSLLDPLTTIIESIIDEDKQIRSASEVENIAIQQMAVMAVKLLSKRLAEKHPKQFKRIVETLIEILRNNTKVPRILLATVVLSLCEICSNLRVHSIPYFNKFMTLFLDILKIQSIALTVNNDNVLICLITGLQKIVSTLALYLSPYLVELIVQLSLIWHALEKESTEDVKRVSAVIERLNGIWEKISSTLELRVLIPSIDKSYKQLVSSKQSLAIGPVMKLLSRSIEHNLATSISNFMPDSTTFFTGALQFRGDHNGIKLSDANKLEDQIIKSFATLTLKLSEGSFRPLYHHIYDWAIKHSDNDIDRAITYFRLSTEIAKSLKSLFVLFAGDFIDDAAALLKKSNDEESSNRDKTALLIQSIVETLYQIFLHDNRGFINGIRFDTLLQPLVDLIENDIVLEVPSLMSLVSMVLAQLGIAANDDIQWKSLNYQILMKTRNNESNVRLFGMRVCVELASKLGEDYMPLLPETVPFISELLEDDNPEVEKQCQRSVQELEEILGEPLQKYF